MGIGCWWKAAGFWTRKRPREKGAELERAEKPSEWEGESKEKECGGKVKRRWTRECERRCSKDSPFLRRGTKSKKRAGFVAVVAL